MLKEKNIWLISAGLLIVVVGLVLFYLFYFKETYSFAQNVFLNEELTPSNLAVSSTIEIKKPDPLKFLFFGDLMLDRHVGDILKKEPLPILLGGLPDGFFDGYNLVGVNLESAVIKNGKHSAPINKYDFSFDPGLIKILADNYHFNFFNLANNHITDQGEAGFTETQKNLDELGLDYSGCPDKQVGDCSYKIVEINNKKIGMAGFSMVYGIFDEDKAVKIISELASSTDFTIVNIHWGVEYAHNFNAVQKKLGHRFIDAGADMVVGHHPHVVQGMEIYNNKPIFYSLGNFVFDQYFSSDTQEGLALSINIENKKGQVELMPMFSVKSHPALMDESKKIDFLKRFTSWSSLDDHFKNQVLSGIIPFTYQ